MANYVRRSLCVTMLVAAGAAGALAQTSTSSSSAADTPLFQWGGDFRLRYEAYDAVHTLSDSAPFHHRDYFRARLRLWETTTPFPDLTLFGRISAEPRYWYQAASKVAEGTEWKYGLFDNLYAKWTTEASGNPIVVVAGRQDIQLGDQWLVSDGTPIDGSWTNHFDAVRFSLDAKSIKTKFEVIALNQQAYPDDRLPMLGRTTDLAHNKYYLQEQDETGVVLYASNKSIKNVQLDGYFMYKGDDAVMYSATSKGYNADLYTLGGRIAGTPEAHWLYSVEAAYQFGRRNDATGTFNAVNNLEHYGEISRDVSAFGGIAKVVYSFKDTLNNQLTFSTEYLSGDKTGTGKDEMFDNLWGRIPRISECWAVALGQDTGRTSQYGNLYRFGATWSIAPTKNTTVSATYGALFAVEDTPTRSTSANFSRDGNFRGHIFQVVLKQKFTKQLSGLLLAEYCPMGNYYTHEDAMTFLRAEMLVTF